MQTIKGREIKAIFLILLLTLSASCTNQVIQGTPQTSPTFLRLEPTWTPHITTFTPSPTSIIVYTHTPTFTPWPTPTITATLHREPTKTPYYLKADFPNACSEEYFDYTTQISPDGNWLAENCYSLKGMQVSNRIGTVILFVPFKDFYNDPLFPELMGSVRPVHWSNDNQYIYFTVTSEQWMDGNASISELAPTLFRLKIVGKEIHQILNGIFYHSFSPTDRRLVEVQEYKHPVKLIIHDLKSGTSESIIPNDDSRYSQAGRVVWSPNGLKFAFVAGFGFEYGDDVTEPMAHSLILVDLADLSQQTIISEIPDQIEPVLWDENDIIIYEIFNYSNRHETRTIYKYD